MNNNFNIGTFHTNNAAVNLGGTIHGDQIGTQTQYINDPEVRGAIAWKGEAFGCKKLG